MNATLLRDALSRFATGVTVVTTLGADGAPQGATANAFSSVSLDPPLILVCLAHTSNTLTALREHGSFAVNVLGSAHEELARSFARSGNETAWADPEHLPGPSGSPLLEGVHAAIDCKVFAVYPGGDHDIVVGEVQHILVEDEPGDALLWFRSTFGTVRDPRGEVVAR
jgi:3-hydroxy-9,10-secoandrosta-1,3,5(10)-triene-9,17-dione monooxygenase reductase component